MASEDWRLLADATHGIVGKNLESIPAVDADLYWRGYLVADTGTREVVGACAFKTELTADGDVEIAHFTFSNHERCGYATAMAAKLIALATKSQAVSTIVAHTLPEKDAPTRVLEKNGI